MRRDGPPGMGSEDFSFMMEKVTGAHINLGNGDSAALHNHLYHFNDDAPPSARPAGDVGGTQARRLMLGLGLDGGGSATRWAISDGGGTILAAGEVAAISGHLFSEVERGVMRAAAAALAGALRFRLAPWWPASRGYPPPRRQRSKLPRYWPMRSSCRLHRWLLE